MAGQLEEAHLENLADAIACLRSQPALLCVKKFREYDAFR